jgi:hypothetical protein
MDGKRRFIRAAAAVILAVLLPMNVAMAGKNKIGNLGSEWWQWVLSIPSSVNPLLDPDGGNCMVAQHGAAWFLAGSWLAGPVTRDCDVPHGVAVFFPVINNVNFDTPNQCGQTDPLPSSFYRGLSKAYIDAATNLSVLLDGKPVKMTRMQSKVFELSLPEDNVFVSAGICAALADGVYSPAVDDGFYVQLNGLTVGAHLLVIHAENQGATLDVTYNLNVVQIVTE